MSYQYILHNFGKTRLFRGSLKGFGTKISIFMYCSGSGSNIPLSKDNQVKNTFPIIGFMSAIFLNIIIVFPRYIPILVPHDTFRCTYCTHCQNDPFLYQISTFHPSIQPNHIVSKLVTFTIVITHSTHFQNHLLLYQPYLLNVILPVHIISIGTKF